MIIRRADPSEAAILTDLTMRSKASWGYDADFMREVAPQMQVIPDQIANSWTYLLTDETTIYGYYMLINPREGDLWLESLFIEPTFKRMGYGRQLLDHALGLARELGYQTVTLESDPFAVRFYQQAGAHQIGEQVSTMRPGRILPIIRFELI
ncbi:MAG: GNAT family N-acetyltransferase [Anaerolineae bacterium]|jgi:GNAT superfamily N-acetyltransferase|nr:GNAT family N-acetyltransferase [Anaerolineae bacterium]